MLLAATLTAAAGSNAADLRIGIIGLDTSHVVAFTKLLNDPNTANHIPGGRVVAAYKSGSPDMPEKSFNRIEPTLRSSPAPMASSFATRSRKSSARWMRS